MKTMTYQSIIFAVSDKGIEALGASCWAKTQEKLDALHKANCEYGNDYFISNNAIPFEAKDWNE